jgi:hypothetical protein
MARSYRWLHLILEPKPLIDGGLVAVESTDVWGFGAVLDRNGHRVVSLWVDEDTERGEPTTMAETLSMALAELLRKADAEPDLDTLREGVRVMTQALMELEIASQD